VLEDENETEVLLYPRMGNPDFQGDETLNPERHVFSEVVDGTLAESVVAPKRNVVLKPKELSMESVSVLGVSWLTSWHMLFMNSGIKPRQRILIQGARGGVAMALIQLGVATGMKVSCVGQDANKRDLASRLGAAQVLTPGEKMAELADAVFDMSGVATFPASRGYLKSGGMLGFVVDIQVVRFG
jgi:NADPH:quinone reductase-like Zn-dependent oxidoreductase